MAYWHHWQAPSLPLARRSWPRFYPVYYLAQRIAGDKAEVSITLRGNPRRPWLRNSARDAAKVQTSDLFIHQDDEMEHFVEDLANSWILTDQDSKDNRRHRTPQGRCRPESLKTDTMRSGIWSIWGRASWRAEEGPSPWIWHTLGWTQWPMPNKQKMSRRPWWP